ncbi:hypothetical protein C6A87_023070 [Mycobacterium sp. ITM-2016-00317]|uniref:hypothetical protein n=1 Tax=Mycobacterium sp. ITM-2016-00317 TaxID=2099694 RepID=UPI00287F475A|nr:hypothetical protein [Mycobacterium sp. ITM-2016-00317]WNG86666.1 hypothetical protein C6A87_023070 [Mycobacterium sp. ITM-2016-00317]
MASENRSVDDRMATATREIEEFDFFTETALVTGPYPYFGIGAATTAASSPPRGLSPVSDGRAVAGCGGMNITDKEN